MLASNKVHEGVISTFEAKATIHTIPYVHVYIWSIILVHEMSFKGTRMQVHNIAVILIF